MKVKNTNRMIRDQAAMLAIAIALAGSSCALQNDQDASGLNGSQSLDEGLVITAPGGVLGTLSVVSFDNVLGNMASVAGVTPSVADNNAQGGKSTLKVYNENKSSFAITGSSNEINAGMWMSVSVLAGGICRDLYYKERALPAASRVYYKDIELANAGNFTRMVDGETVERRLIKRLVLGMWGRAPLPAELTAYDAALDIINTNRAALAEVDTREALLIMCTGTLASLNGIEI